MMAAMMKTSRWGVAPTPVLPRWYLENLADYPLPIAVKQMNPRARTIGDLDQFWDTARTRVDASLLTKSVMQCLNNRLPPVDLVVIPGNVDRSWLLESPLRVRTVNSLGRAKVFEQREPTTVDDLMAVQNFGITSLIDLMCVMESAQPLPNPIAVTATPDEAVTMFDDEELAWLDLLKQFRLVFTAAREFFGATTVREVCDLDVAWLTEVVGVTGTMSEVTISSIIGDRSICLGFLVALESFIEQTSEGELLILHERILADKPRSYRDIGNQVGITAEAIRRRTIRLNTRLETDIGPHLDIISALFKRLLGPVAPIDNIDYRINDAFAEGEPPIAHIAGQLVRQRLSYYTYGDTGISLKAKREAANLKEVSQHIADDVGIVDERELRQSLSHSRWESYWDDLLACAGLVRVGTQIALRDTKRVRLKAAIMDLNRPATKNEIAMLSGVPPDRISGNLGHIQSIVRADKHSWGLADQVEEVYESIASGIANLVKESGGIAPLGWLTAEMKRRFGAREASVRTYAHTAQFVVEDNFIRLAEDSDIRLKNLDEVITGRDTRGCAYWTFPVLEPYFRGYGLNGLPPEIAAELGCGPNCRITAEVLHPAGAKPLSVIWRLNSLGGAYIGFLSDPLQRLNAEAGMDVRIVIRGTGLVELQLE